MEQSIPPKRKGTVSTVLLILFLAAEIIFLQLVINVGNGDIGGAILKTILIGTLIGLAYQKKNGRFGRQALF